MIPATLPPIPYAYTPGMCKHQSFIKVLPAQVPALQLRTLGALLLNEADFVSQDNVVLCIVHGAASQAHFAYFTITFFRPALPAPADGGVVVHMVNRMGRGVWSTLQPALHDYLTCPEAELATQASYRARERRRAPAMLPAAEPEDGVQLDLQQQTHESVRAHFFRLNSPETRMDALAELADDLGRAQEKRGSYQAMILECLLCGHPEDAQQGVYPLETALRALVELNPQTRSSVAGREHGLSPLLYSVVDALLYSCLPGKWDELPGRGHAGGPAAGAGGEGMLASQAPAHACVPDKESMMAYRRRQLAALSLTRIMQLGSRVALGHGTDLSRRARARLVASVECILGQVVADLPQDLQSAIHLDMTTLGSLRTLRINQAMITQASATATTLRTVSIAALKASPGRTGESTWIQTPDQLPVRCPAALYPASLYPAGHRTDAPSPLPPRIPGESLFGFMAHAHGIEERIKTLAAPLKGRLEEVRQGWYAAAADVGKLATGGHAELLGQ